MPRHFEIRLVDAYETDQSALLLIRKTYETRARIAACYEMSIIGAVIGPSLLHHTLEKTVAQIGEDIPLRPRTQETSKGPQGTLE